MFVCCKTVFSRMFSIGIVVVLAARLLLNSIWLPNMYQRAPFQIWISSVIGTLKDANKPEIIYQYIPRLNYLRDCLLTGEHFRPGAAAAGRPVRSTKTRVFVTDGTSVELNGVCLVFMRNNTQSAITDQNITQVRMHSVAFSCNGRSP